MDVGDEGDAPSDGLPAGVASRTAAIDALQRAGLVYDWEDEIMDLCERCGGPNDNLTTHTGLWFVRKESAGTRTVFYVSCQRCGSEYQFAPDDDYYVSEAPPRYPTS
jgi:hypothetical protein